jgi:hypothetical protein
VLTLASCWHWLAATQGPTGCVRNDSRAGTQLALQSYHPSFRDCPPTPVPGPPPKAGVQTELCGKQCYTYLCCVRLMFEQPHCRRRLPVP